LQPKFAGRRHWYRLRYLRALACLRFPEREPGLFRLADSGRMDSLRASLVRPRTRSASPARSADATGKAAWSGFGRHRVPSRNDTGIAAPRAKPTGIDKSLLAIGKARRYRDKNHLKFVASQPCVFLWAKALRPAPPSLRPAPGAWQNNKGNYHTRHFICQRVQRALSKAITEDPIGPNASAGFRWSLPCARSLKQ
jgi:hypothetical protein